MQLNKYKKEAYILPHDRAWWKRHPNILVLEYYKDFLKGSIVDLGCNNGMYASFIPEISTKKTTPILGIDIYAHAIENA